MQRCWNRSLRPARYHGVQFTSLRGFPCDNSLQIWEQEEYFEPLQREAACDVNALKIQAHLQHLVACFLHTHVPGNAETLNCTVQSNMFSTLLHSENECVTLRDENCELISLRRTGCKNQASD